MAGREGVPRLTPPGGADGGEERRMATLTVWRFDTADGARTALATLQRLQKEELIQVLDAAIVSWPDGRRRPKTEQLHDLTRTGALAGAFWGLLFGLIFFVPLLGHVEEVADRGLRAQAAPAGGR